MLPYYWKICHLDCILNTTYSIQILVNYFDNFIIIPGGLDSLVVPSGECKQVAVSRILLRSWNSDKRYVDRTP